MISLRRGLAAPALALMAGGWALLPAGPAAAEGPAAGAGVDAAVAASAQAGGGGLRLGLDLGLRGDLRGDVPPRRVLDWAADRVIDLDGGIAVHGRGSVAVTGDARVIGSVRDARLVVVDHAGDATVRLNERDRHGVTVEGRTEFTIRDFDGRLVIAGSRVEVRIEHGVDIDLWARGSGSVALDGHGWVRLAGGLPRLWAPAS